MARRYAIIPTGMAKKKPMSEGTWCQSLKGIHSEMHSLWHGPTCGPYSCLPNLAFCRFRRQSGTHYSSTYAACCASTCLRCHWMLVMTLSPTHWTLTLYKAQKTRSGPLPRVAHYLTRYSSSREAQSFIIL